jgi:hypothetical protein
MNPLDKVFACSRSLSERFLNVFCSGLHGDERFLEFCFRFWFFSFIAVFKVKNVCSGNV